MPQAMLRPDAGKRLILAVLLFASTTVLAIPLTKGGVSSPHPPHDVAAEDAAGRGGMTAGAAADLVTDLPGLPAGVNFRQFAGYIPVHPGRSLFYWFVESQGTNPSTDPVVLWTNGGPGCSGMTGFLSEQGPFRAMPDGELKMNPYAWNKVANMIFIEQPAGVGFSPVSGPVHYGDEMAATDNAEFVKKWFARYPEYAKTPFYITSESYGGHYLPTLAAKLQDAKMPNFKGFAVGNPLTWMPLRDYGQYATYAAHQMVPRPLWNSFESNKCRNDLTAAKCQDIMAEIDSMTADVDPYALDFPMCTAPGDSGHALMRKLHSMRIDNTESQAKGLGGYFPGKYLPCSDNYMVDYLNRKDVQAAIHIEKPGSVDWQPCNDHVNSEYNVTDVAAPMMQVYEDLISKGGLKILVYSGDDDSICSTIGTQMWIWDLTVNKEGGVVDKWKPWKTKGQVSGYTVAWKGMRFTTVHGAGHMVPSTRPAQALDLFRRFLHADGWSE